MLDKSYGIPGCVKHNADDSYTIFIDASLNYEKQHEVFLHEMRNHMNDYLEIASELFPDLNKLRIAKAI